MDASVAPETASEREPIIEMRDGNWDVESFVRSPSLERMALYLTGIGQIGGSTFKDLQRVLLDGKTEGVDLPVFVKDLRSLQNYFAGPHYSRLTRKAELPSDPMDITSGAFLDRVADDCEAHKDKVAHIIKETCRRALRAAGVRDNVRCDVDTRPKTAAGELPGSVLKFPSKYVKFAAVPVVMYESVTPENDNNTPSNKRVHAFSEIGHNPLDRISKVGVNDFIGLPLIVGGSFIMVYVDKHQGWAEMEAGLAALFPLATAEEITSRKIDGIFVLGDAKARFNKPDPETLQYDEERNDYGYFYDRENDMIVGSVPDIDEFKYFGYAKKPILTLGNVRAIERGDFPLHCASNRFHVVFDAEGNPSVDTKRSAVLADDMGFMRLVEEEGGKQKLKFFGTEVGGFACLDGYSPRTREMLAPTGIGYNLAAGAKTGNARSVVPLDVREEIERGSDIDLFLTMNNYTVFPKGNEDVLDVVERDGDSEKDTSHEVERFLKALRNGRRIAAGSTATKAGEFEDSYYHNPFPLLKILRPEGVDDTVVVPGLYERFRVLKGRYEGAIKNMVCDGDMKVGVANSQMMTGAGVDLCELALAGHMPKFIAQKIATPGAATWGKKMWELMDNDEKLEVLHFIQNDLTPEEQAKWRNFMKDHMEAFGPQVLAKALEKKVLAIAIEKRKKLLAAGLPADSVDVTTVQVGDSRNGKSETLAAMQDEWAERASQAAISARIAKAAQAAAAVSD